MPNAVAAKLLVEDGGTVFMVHSSDSLPVAQKINAWLKKDSCRLTVKYVEVKESAPASIYTKVREHFKENKVSSVGLNYTGGTKMMAVHAYRAVEDWAVQNDVEPVFSYLDADTLKMVFDPPRGSLRERRVYVGEAVSLTLSDFLALHGWSLKNLPRLTALLPETARAIGIAYANKPTFKEKWKTWLKQKEERKNEAKESIDHLSMPDEEEIKGVYCTLCRELGQPVAILPRKQTYPNGLSEEFDLFEGYLKGKWLEHYLFTVLHEKKESLGLTELLRSIEPNEIQFEVDVMAVRGHQLFAFSCKTGDTRRDLKLALFEAYTRARQLGGDEARVALVCCSDEPESIEAEIKRDFGIKGRIRVFGREHLADLGAQVSDWMRSQFGEEG